MDTACLVHLGVLHKLIELLAGSAAGKSARGWQPTLKTLMSLPPWWVTTRNITMMRLLLSMDAPDLTAKLADTSNLFLTFKILT